jgi:uncharacterized protein YdaU (DUF1376 family)
MHYYKRHIGDYAKKAGRLSILEHGVYTLLMDACYDKEKFPESVEEAIDWVWARSPEEEAAVKFVLSKFFVLTDGFYVQNHIQEVLNEYQEFCGEQKEKGKKGGRPKKNLAEENNPTETQRVISETQRVANGFENKPADNPKPLTTNHKPLTTNQNKNKTILVEGEPSTSGNSDSIGSIPKQTAEPVQKAEHEQPPPDQPVLKSSKAPPCPHMEIIALYHEILPECPQVITKLWPDSNRATWLQARWRQCKEHQNLNFWKRYFEEIRNLSNGYYISKEVGHPWIADLGWLVSKENFIKLVGMIENNLKAPENAPKLAIVR